MTPSSDVLIALAKALEVSLEFLAAPMDVRLGALEFARSPARARRIARWSKRRCSSMSSVT